MVFNTKKNYIRYSVGRMTRTRESEYEAPGSVAIERAHEVNDLRVLLENNLTFSINSGKATRTV